MAESVDYDFSVTYASLAMRLSDVFAQHRMPSTDFDQLLAIAAERELPLLAQWIDGDHDAIHIYKEDADAFTNELQAVRSATDNPDLHRHIDALLDLTDRLAAMPADSISSLMIESGFMSRRMG